MKYKFFTADSQTGIEKEVNEWVAKQKPAVTIRLSDTKMQKVTDKNRAGMLITVGIWYK